MAKTIWIPEYLSENKTESSNDQTLYIDLPKKEQISFLKLDLSVQNVAGQQLLRTIMDVIEKIEVIADGVKTLYNLEPEIASYLQFVTQNGIFPKHNFNYTSLARQTLELIIPFGRFLYDEQYLLDTGLYDSVQLRIPYTLNATYDTLATFRHTVVMYRPLERLSPVGMIRNRTVQKEVFAGSAIETIHHKLPMALPWRFLGVRVEDVDKNIATNVTRVKLNINEGRLIPYDLRINELLDMDRVRFPEISGYKIMGSLANEDMCRGHVDYPYPRAIVSSGVQPLIFRLYWAIGEQVGLKINLHDGTEWTSPMAIDLHVSGSNPHKCMTLFDGREDPFPAKEHTQAKVEYTMSANAATLHTFIQEVVTGRLT